MSRAKSFLPRPEGSYLLLAGIRTTATMSGYRVRAGRQVKCNDNAAWHLLSYLVPDSHVGQRKRNRLMLTTQQLTDILQQQLPYLSDEYGITRLGIFGSYTKGVAREQSDIDLVAEFKTPLGLKFVELTDYLEQLLDAPVDVLTPAGIQAIRNAKAAKDIQESIVYV